MHPSSPIGAIVWLTPPAQPTEGDGSLPRRSHSLRASSSSPISSIVTQDPSPARLKAWAAGLRRGGCDPVLLIAATAEPDSGLVWVQHRRPELGMVSAVATALSWASGSDVVIASASGEVPESDEIEQRVGELLQARAVHAPSPATADMVIVWSRGRGSSATIGARSTGDTNPADPNFEASSASGETAEERISVSRAAERMIDGQTQHELGTTDGALWPNSWGRVLWRAIQNGEIEPFVRHWSTKCLSISGTGDLS